MFRSDNAGATWQRMNGDSGVRERAWYYSHIIADPQDADTVYVLTLEINKSIDGGRTFQMVRAAHSDNHGLWIAPDDPQRMINGNDGGAAITSNGGRTWTTAAEPADGAVLPRDHRQPVPVSRLRRSAGQLHGVDRQPHRRRRHRRDRLVRRRRRRERLHRPGSPRPEHRLCRHLLRRDDAVRSPPGRIAERVDLARDAWRPSGGRREIPLPVDRADRRSRRSIRRRSTPAANVLFKSTDQGQSWQAISPDLTRNDKTKQGHNGGPLTGDNSSADYYCTIFTVAPSRLEKDTIWTGSDDGLVHVTRDGGKNWKNVTPKQMAEWTRVNIIEASPHAAGTAYVAATRYQSDDFKPYIYRTTDYGATWTVLGRGIPDTSFVRVVREDPARKGLLYAGTETGVYVSFDDGATWQPLQLNLPVVPITDLAVQGSDLVASTQGRAFWILDDLSVIRQMNAQVAGSRGSPVPAARDVSHAGGRWRRRWRRRVGCRAEPVVRRRRVVFLERGRRTSVALEVLDRNGRTIRTFRSRENPAGEGGSERRAFLGPPPSRAIVPAEPA